MQKYDQNCFEQQPIYKDAAKSAFSEKYLLFSWKVYEDVLVSRKIRATSNLYFIHVMSCKFLEERIFIKIRVFLKSVFICWCS